MSQTSTASKLSHAHPSNHEIAPTISETDVEYSSSNLARRQETSSIRGDQDGLSEYTVGCEVHNNVADKDDDETCVEHRLDFGLFQVPGREEHIETLHKIYNYVCRGFDRRINQWVGEASVAIIGGSSGTRKSTLIKQF